jgi:DNA/RNA endonuclease YhcR with UshA esterase domain
MKRRLVFLGVVVLAWWSAASGIAEDIDATDLEALRAAAGTEVAVVGHVTEVGTTQDGGITFINVGLPKKQGFVAVVFRADYAAFPDGFDQFRNARVRVSGVLELYRGDQPQIKLSSPEQIAILAE